MPIGRFQESWRTEDTLQLALGACLPVRGQILEDNIWFSSEVRTPRSCIVMCARRISLSVQYLIHRASDGNGQKGLSTQVLASAKPPGDTTYR